MKDFIKGALTCVAALCIGYTLGDLFFAEKPTCRVVFEGGSEDGVTMMSPECAERMYDWAEEFVDQNSGAHK